MLIFQGVKGFRENHHHFYSGFFFRLQWWIAGFQVCRLKHLWIFSLWFGDKEYFLQKSTTWAEILNTKKCPHPLKLRWIPQKMMGRLENLYIFCSFKLWQQSRYILGIYFRGENSHVKTSHSLKSVVSSRWWKGKSYVLGEATDSVWIGAPKKWSVEKLLSTRWFKVTFLGWWKRDLLERLSDLQLGDQKVTLNHLVVFFEKVKKQNLFYDQEWAFYLYEVMIL